MAWIEKRKRTDGGVSARVKWRLGGARDGAPQLEVFSAGSDAQHFARADGSTIDTHGHLLSAGDELISGLIDLALSGGTIRPPTLR